MRAQTPALALLAGILATQATGAPVPIDNPGFEADPAAPNTFPTGPVTAWPAYDPFNLLSSGGNATGVINPTGSTFFPGGAPEGDNAAILFISQNIGAGPVGLSQTLATTWQAGTTYTLTVEVGNIASGTGSPPFDTYGFFDLDGFPGYSVQLLANGAVMAEDYNSLTIPEGEFATSEIEVTVPDGSFAIGLPIEIRLINLNFQDTPEDPGIEVDFDDVRLDAAPPCPADVNNDGVLDNADIGDFVGYYLSSDPASDFNNDGVIDNGDIGAFVTAFLAGC